MSRLGLGLRLGLVAAVAAVVSGSAAAVTGRDRIVTIAGSSMFPGFSGDGGPATRARFGGPTGVAVDAAGNVYIADTAGYRVRKVSPRGRITTFACTGRRGFSGDGGPATRARCRPSGVAVDGRGNVYITDPERVRKVSRDGRITTIAGTGVSGFSGDGGLATSARLSYPTGVAVDGQGNVYVADTNNNRVRRIATDGRITTFAGTGGPGPLGDGGPATAARLSAPFGVAVDAQGNVYIADSGGHRVRKVDVAGTITTIAGNGREGTTGDGGRATSASLGSPLGLAVDRQGNVYVAGDDRVRRVSPSGTIARVVGTGRPGFSGDGGPAISARLSGPWGLALDARSRLYIVDGENRRVRRVGRGLRAAAVRHTPAQAECSMATALEVARPLFVWGDSVRRPIAQVLCGPFTGPGSEAMAVTLVAPTCWPVQGWAVYRFVDGAWQLVLSRPYVFIFRLDAVGGDIRETAPVFRRGDSRCTPSGGKQARSWHWNGMRLAAGPWRQTTRSEPAGRGFYSPSRNISCGMFDDSRYRYVKCQSRVPPQVARLNARGQVTSCRNRSAIDNHCGLGDPGENVIPTLAYGRQITVGRFRCLSLQVGVRCTVIRSGKGFLINRAGIRRVGP